MKNNLTDTEKLILMESLRRNFDHPGTDIIECKIIISLYEKFELGPESIQEIKNDFLDNFNKEY